MVLTHIAVGMALSLPVAVVAPDLAASTAVGGAIGGAFPDVDLLFGDHRRTLHFPVLYWPPAIALAVVALVVSPITIVAAVVVGAAAVHSASDVLGAGEELRPWERTNPDAVYDHLRGRWLRAQYIVRYDGAPEDLLLTVAFSTPVAVCLDGLPRWIAVLTVILALPYTIVRKRLPNQFEKIL
ncbi:metal-dependent hydrolase [Halocatena salina]|uniref:Metal-dependent hydrolase n=1 Tax=Halocatena salina TaxID=2934340 RepID=A0A8U0A0V3_9EURY|nr:metal-dependent hydrolase [Halocatena salina]UPM42750.1 metal-dependent hydrolase [Halocatena salina]